jgi:hypothetical protein
MSLTFFYSVVCQIVHKSDTAKHMPATPKEKKEKKKKEREVAILAVS